ncbi:hypothetical protein QZH41_014185, partial [Actinostola sp. cb2023]
MAEESVKRSVHHSIFKRVEGNTLQLIECRLTDCKECSSLKKGLYHCPLCPLSFRIRSRLKEHHVSVHWNSRISFAGIEVCVKFCPRCNLPYRYQEFNDGVHNFNDFWIFSLGFMDLIRQFFKVHTAFSRVCQAVEGWLGLEGLPSSIIRNAYLHYEALCDHKYQYFCVLCGHHPPFLVTDADKKGMFDLSASELDVPEDNNDEVDADLFWNQVCLAMVYRGFLHTGLSDVHNPFIVKPSYKFWAPWIGRHSRASEKILNTEYKKCHHDKDVAESGTRHQMNVEDVVEILEQGSVKVLKELCQKLLIADTARQSKIDLIKKLKVQLGIPSEFVKVFSKFWGGSGGWLGAACQHGVCYGIKWLVRQEGARDHVDLIRSLAHQPNFVVVDFANQVAAHGNKRYPGMFSPYDGRVLPATVENIYLAKLDKVSLDMPWVSSAYRGESWSPPSIEGGRECHPTSGSNSYYCLFDTFHEDNSSSDKDLLRRTRCVKQLEGWFCTEVMEHLNNIMNKNNYFTTQMSATNAIFVQRLAMELSNEEKNCKSTTLHEKQVSNDQSVFANLNNSSINRNNNNNNSRSNNNSSSNRNNNNNSRSSNNSNTSNNSSSSSSNRNNNNNNNSNNDHNSSSNRNNNKNSRSSNNSNTSSSNSSNNSSSNSSNISSSSSSNNNNNNNSNTSSSNNNSNTSSSNNNSSSNKRRRNNRKAVCQSRLCGRTGSNACTIITLLSAEQFLQQIFYPTPFQINCMFAFVTLMIQGNALYDTVVGDEAGFFDAYEAIQVSGMEDFLEVSRVEGIVDTSDQLPKLCQEFFSEGGAHIIIIPPDNSVLV